MLTALVLAIWAYVAICDNLAPRILMAGRPLMARTVAGFLLGDVQTVMMVGGTLELMALGVYTYGGATILDYWAPSSEPNLTGSWASRPA